MDPQNNIGAPRPYLGGHNEALIAWVTKIVVVVLLLIPLLQIFSPRSDRTSAPSRSLPPSSQPAEEIQTRFSAESPSATPPPPPPPQPSCPISYVLTMLKELSNDIWYSGQHCRPEDIHNAAKHQLPSPPIVLRATGGAARNHSDHRTRIVSILAGGLLMCSLGATFFELYRSRKISVQKSKSFDVQQNNNRKFSLADLTVLKHYRRDLLSRRDSGADLAVTAMATAPNRLKSFNLSESSY